MFGIYSFALQRHQPEDNSVRVLTADSRLAAVTDSPSTTQVPHPFRPSGLLEDAARGAALPGSEGLSAARS
jgi:hypothetical protein